MYKLQNDSVSRIIKWSKAELKFVPIGKTDSLKNKILINYNWTSETSEN